MALFDGLTPETILERVLGRMDTGLQTREGSYAYDQAAPICFELWRVLMTLGELIEAFYVGPKSGKYLDDHAKLFALSRREGVKARAGICFSGRDGVGIPAGTAFFTGDGLEFRLKEDAVIRGGSAFGTIEAAEVGARYNVGPGAVSRILRNIAGLEGFEAGDADGGADPEPDADLFARLDDKRKRPPTSGNEDHYREWALSVDGVGAVRVKRCWAGPGTVRVLITGYDRRPVDQAVVDACAAYIESRRPVGADVTVASAQAVEVDIAVHAVLEPGADPEAVRAAFVAALDGYLRELAFEQYTVYANRVGALLMGVDGVRDYTGLAINGSGENLILDGDEVPIPGKVTVV